MSTFLQEEETTPALDGVFTSQREQEGCYWAATSSSHVKSDMFK